MDILPGVLHNGVVGAGPVGNAPCVAEVDDVLAGQNAAQLAHGGQAAQAAVKYTDGSCIHQ